MKRSYFTIGIFLVLGVAVAVSLSGVNLSTDMISGLSKQQESLAAKPPGLGNPAVHKITDKVHAVTGLYMLFRGKIEGVAAGVIFTARSVIFIDAGMTIASAEFLWNVARERMKGNEDIYLILTHHHVDHVLGMRVMKERGARVVAHKSASEELKNATGEQYKAFLMERFDWDREEADKILGDVKIYPADQEIEKDTVLKIDGEEIHLLVTPGHHPDELSIYHPNSQTLFAGDTIYEGFPPNTKFGGPEEWKQWISQLERLKKLKIKTIVPGHGNLCSKDEIDRNIAFLKRLLNRQALLVPKRQLNELKVAVKGWQKKSERGAGFIHALKPFVRT